MAQCREPKCRNSGQERRSCGRPETQRETGRERASEPGGRERAVQSGLHVQLFTPLAGPLQPLRTERFQRLPNRLLHCGANCSETWWEVKAGKLPRCSSLAHLWFLSPARSSVPVMIKPMLLSPFLPLETHLSSMELWEFARSSNDAGKSTSQKRPLFALSWRSAEKANSLLHTRAIRSYILIPSYPVSTYLDAFHLPNCWRALLASCQPGQLIAWHTESPQQIFTDE